jgi:hypothetical protein
MQGRPNSSRFERFGGAAVLLLLSGLALYHGVMAVSTGEFAASGGRSNPSAVTYYFGAPAYWSGAFLVSVGATLLVLPWAFAWRSLLLRVALGANVLLFIAAAVSYGRAV